MTLAVCLLLDERGDAVVRGIWRRLEETGIRTLQTHTHGRHVPHLTYATVPGDDLDPVVDAVASLPPREPIALHLDAFGTFRRSRCWLAPAVVPGLVERQAAVVDALTAVGAEVHRNYREGSWIPHLTLAPRLHLRDLAAVARVVYDVLPVVAVAELAAVIDTGTGDVSVLPGLP